VSRCASSVIWSILCGAVSHGLLALANILVFLQYHAKWSAGKNIPQISAPGGVWNVSWISQLNCICDKCFLLFCLYYYFFISYGNVCIIVCVYVVLVLSLRGLLQCCLLNCSTHKISHCFGVSLCIPVLLICWARQSSRKHLRNDNCLEHKSKGYQNCSVLCCIPLHMHIWPVLMELIVALGLLYVLVVLSCGFLCLGISVKCFLYLLLWLVVQSSGRFRPDWQASPLCLEKCWNDVKFEATCCYQESRSVQLLEAVLPTQIFANACP